MRRNSFSDQHQHNDPKYRSAKIPGTGCKQTTEPPRVCRVNYSAAIGGNRKALNRPACKNGHKGMAALVDKCDEQPNGVDQIIGKWQKPQYDRQDRCGDQKY